MSCKPSGQFLRIVLETTRDDLWNKVGVILESQGTLLNSTYYLLRRTLELITIHYLISNQIEFKVQNKFAMCKNLKLNTIYGQSTDRIFVMLPHLLGPRCVSFQECDQTFPGLKGCESIKLNHIQCVSKKFESKFAV